MLFINILEIIKKVFLCNNIYRMKIKNFKSFNEELQYDSYFKEPIPHYGDVWTVSEFEEAVENGDIMKDDGIGFYSDGEFMNRKAPVFNSEKPEDATYVVWFAK